MRRSLLLPALALTLVLAACAQPAGPGWTYAPPSEAPASPPTTSAEPTSVPATETPGGDGVVTVTAEMINFLEKDLSAPADAPFVIRFDNRDAGVPHDVAIRDASGQEVFKGETFNGAEIRDYQVPALAAGTYQFVCTIHPNMVGTLTVGG